MFQSPPTYDICQLFKTVIIFILESIDESWFISIMKCSFSYLIHMQWLLEGKGHLHFFRFLLFKFLQVSKNYIVILLHWNLTSCMRLLSSIISFLLQKCYSSWMQLQISIMLFVMLNNHSYVILKYIYYP